MLAFLPVFPWLVLPAIAFYGILLVLVLVAAAFAVDEVDSLKEGQGFWTFLFGPAAIFLLLKGFSNISLPHFTAGQWVGIAAGYLLVGGVWTVYKWFKVVRSQLAHSIKAIEDEARNMRARVNRDNRVDTIASRYSNATTIPTASNHKELISFWILLWPFSFIGTFTGDITGIIQDALASIYNRISARAQRQVTQRIAELDAAFIEEQRAAALEAAELKQTQID